MLLYKYIFYIWFHLLFLFYGAIIYPLNLNFRCLYRYVEVNMDSAAIVWPLFNSLQAFWPGLQVFSFSLFLILDCRFYDWLLLNLYLVDWVWVKVLAGDIDPAIRTHAAFFSVWKRYGFTPEGFNLATLTVQVSRSLLLEARESYYS